MARRREADKWARAGMRRSGSGAGGAGGAAEEVDGGRARTRAEGVRPSRAAAAVSPHWHRSMFLNEYFI